MFKLLRHFSVTSAAALIVMTVGLTYFYRTTAVEDLIKTTEIQNEFQARSLVNGLWPQFSEFFTTTMETDGDILRAMPEQAQIDSFLRKAISGLPVLKIKVYNLKGLTLYSSQASQIGSFRWEMKDYQSALHSINASSLYHRNSFYGFEGEVIKRDLVASYIPVYASTGDVEAVFELYTDVSPLMEIIRHTTNKIIAILLAAFGTLYAVLFLIVRRADGVMTRQYKELEEREQSTRDLLEQRLIDAVEGLPQGIILFDADDRMVICNSNYLEFYPDLKGIAKPGVHISKFIEAVASAGGIVHHGPAEEWAELRLKQHQQPSPDYLQETREGRRIHVRDYPTRDGGTVGLRLDVTEQFGRNNQLIAAKEEAESANQSKSMFLANMSHELRTPLNAIIGFSDSMVHGIFGNLNNPRYEEYASHIKQSGEHLLHLINEVLDISRIEAGKTTVDLEYVEIRPLILDLEAMVAPMLDGKPIEFSIHYGEHIDSVRADPSRLRQILLNLIDNAIKFTDAGQITLNIQNIEIEGVGWVDFTLTDTGIGLSKEQMARLFQPFAQADETITRQHGGTGLGLAISRRLCRLMGGDLTVSSELGKGSTFTVEIPGTDIPI